MRAWLKLEFRKVSARANQSNSIQLQWINDILLSPNTADAIKQFSDGPIFEDEKLKCYMDCLFDEMHVKKDAKVDLVAVHESFSEDEEIHNIILHMVRLCLYPTGGNDCDLAYNLHKCWKTRDPKVMSCNRLAN